MKSTYLEKLEFNIIINELCKHCSTQFGIEIASQLIPSNSLITVKELLGQTKEAVALIARNQSPSFIKIDPIDVDLKLLESGSSLSIKSLLNLANILKSSDILKLYFKKDFIDSSNFPILTILFENLYSNPSISERIFSCLIDENTIDDLASKSLQSIRKQKRNLEQDIRTKLNTMIHSSNFSKYIQDNVITIRNDRFVIPVKDEYRNEIKGFIHDVSNAGSTVFIEPIAVFEMNNELAKLNSLEEIEIEKILYELTSLFYPYTNELISDIEIIGNLDFIFAKAKYSKSIYGITPNINDNKVINLISARHPLLDINKAVPITVSIGDTYSTLLITGPNTGGKTVTLKTVGLLTLMACSGLNIPAAENSSIHVFDNIFADIGDEQSISDSLSTFSSHMLNIVEILSKITSNSLVLVDELGSGTDPLEGANLAISILEHIRNTNALTIATTHYQELKHYALVTEGFENASVEFNINTLSPTYNLLIGIPGKSNAFAISKKLGLHESIINRAKSLLSDDEISIEELLKNIYDDKSLIEKEKINIQKELSQISSLRKNLDNELSSLNEKKLNILNKAKSEAREILLDAKDDANDILKELKSISTKKDGESLRNKLNSHIKDISLTSEEPIVDNTNISANDLPVNTHVFVTTVSQNGIIVSRVSRSNEVQVQIGSMKINVPIKYLKIINTPKTNNIKISNNSTYSNLSKSRSANTEINVLGYNVEEAIFVINKFLDDSCIAKLQTVRIVHGKGTGKLRTGIQSYLKTHPHVMSYRVGAFGEGEMGVTIVELK